MTKTETMILQPREIQELEIILFPYKDEAVKVKKQRVRFDVGSFVVTLKNGKEVFEKETEPFPYLTEFRNLEIGKEYLVKDLIPAV